MLGLAPAALRQLSDWAAAGDAVTLRFVAETRCAFAREATRQVESPSVTTTTSVNGAPVKAVSTHVTTTVTDYFWTFEARPTWRQQKMQHT